MTFSNHNPSPLILPFGILNGSPRISLRTLCAFFIFVSLLSFTGCAKQHPVRTEIDFLLQEGRLKQIAASKGPGDNLIFGGKVVRTKVLSVKGNTITEQWHVKRGDREADYIVKLTSVPGGGTHIQVTSP